MLDLCLYGSKGKKIRNRFSGEFLTNPKTHQSQLMSKIEEGSNASKGKN